MQIHHKAYFSFEDRLKSYIKFLKNWNQIKSNLSKVKKYEKSITWQSIKTKQQNNNILIDQKSSKNWPQDQKNQDSNAPIFRPVANFP